MLLTLAGAEGGVQVWLWVRGEPFDRGAHQRELEVLLEASGVFREVEETIYQDACHPLPPGYEFLAEAIGRAFLDGLLVYEEGAPSRLVEGRRGSAPSVAQRDDGYRIGSRTR